MSGQPRRAVWTSHRPATDETAASTDTTANRRGRAASANPARTAAASRRSCSARPRDARLTYIDADHQIQILNQCGRIREVAQFAGEIVQPRRCARERPLDLPRGRAFLQADPLHAWNFKQSARSAFSVAAIGCRSLPWSGRLAQTRPTFNPASVSSQRLPVPNFFRDRQTDRAWCPELVESVVPNFSGRLGKRANARRSQSGDRSASARWRRRACFAPAATSRFRHRERHNAASRADQRARAAQKLNRISERLVGMKQNALSIQFAPIP